MSLKDNLHNSTYTSLHGETTMYSGTPIEKASATVPPQFPNACKRVYVAGPISHTSCLSVFEHMRRGINLCCDLLEKGYSPFCPWIDFQFFLNRPFTMEQIKQYSIDWLDASEAILIDVKVFDGSDGTYPWRLSTGTIAEIKRAAELRIPVYYSLEKLLHEMPPTASDSSPPSSDSPTSFETPHP